MCGGVCRFEVVLLFGCVPGVRGSSPVVGVMVVMINWSCEWERRKRRRERRKIQIKVLLASRGKTKPLIGSDLACKIPQIQRRPSTKIRNLEVLLRLVLLLGGFLKRPLCSNDATLNVHTYPTLIHIHFIGGRFFVGAGV
ncbi:hypothetical protein DM02DRAFT_203654 [Periconia macrospinosa]|uniref:Secreted protein n=1 Tax=Periconia macrospinosa TaxID=97972 RepID=A0A2V1E409_9PLEO|nr:hypothetical protein DM02DRAFT_203654 [Periconia macrospinosa]